MRRFFLSLIAALFIVAGADAHNPREFRKLKQKINFIWASDLDRSGCYDQKVIADMMATVAKKIKPECIISTGDTHHGRGVKSATDPRWKTHFEDIYYHKPLQIDWMPVLGNHEYMGNTQGFLDYSKVNPHWTIPDRYYTRVFKKGGVSIRFVMLDTTPLVEKYRTGKHAKRYPEAAEQDKQEQLDWLKKVLSEAKEEWVIVAGHHPIYADTKKNKSERKDMEKSVDKILRKNENVDMYICGHIHTFQHLRRSRSHIDYLVNASAAESRSVRMIKHTKFCSDEPGFSLITVGKKSLQVHMIDKNGNILHTVKRTK
ncbi:MAG: metallophosphoesterase [Alistipes sp.]|nr:metallophosphoesterase [Alistipes sp.]